MLFFSISSTRLRELPYLSSRQVSTRLNTETLVVKLANDLYLDRLFVKICLRIYTWTDYPYDGWSVSSINRTNEDQWVDFDYSNNSLNAGSFIYGEIIPDLESQLEIEGKVKITWIQSITSSQFSVDNFSNFKVDKRSEVCKCDR